MKTPAQLPFQFMIVRVVMLSQISEQKVTANGLRSENGGISVGRPVIWGVAGGRFLARTENLIFAVQSGPDLEPTT